MTTLTLQTYLDDAWQDAAQLYIHATEKKVVLQYAQDYALSHLFHTLEAACSINLPVEPVLNYEAKGWFSFIEDILPSGASRRYWVERLDISRLSQWEQDIELLQKAVIAPVGNLRIKEALPLRYQDSLETLTFAQNDVVERQVDFLEYAQEMGALSGGATGAGGEAPKLLVRLNTNNRVWIDTFQDNPNNLDRHYLVKFPRGTMSERDCHILRAEYVFLQELNQLGQNTIDAKHTFLIEGERFPSLWLPRFDVGYNANRVTHYGLESLYSILNKSGGNLNHFEVLKTVHETLKGLPGYDAQAFAEEWLKRDLLNVIFGNSDNHGRNTAFIKKNGQIMLSPIFDLAPMKVDLEGIVRTIKWGRPFEAGGEFDWHGIVHQLNESVYDPQAIWLSLKETATTLIGLKERLLKAGLSKEFIHIPALGMNTIETRLKHWKLL